MSLSINPFTTGSTSLYASADLASEPIEPGAVPCPRCGGDVVPIETETGWQSCPSCANRLQARLWPVIRQSTNAAAAFSDQATCFFHPDKVFQACCQRCGRFVCALCDLQLGVEHVCPACFERGRTHSEAEPGKGEWRYRDVLWFFSQHHAPVLPYGFKVAVAAAELVLLSSYLLLIGRRRIDAEAPSRVSENR